MGCGASSIVAPVGEHDSALNIHFCRPNSAGKSPSNGHVADGGNETNCGAAAARSGDALYHTTANFQGLQLLGEGTSGKAYLVVNPLDEKKYVLKSVTRSAAGSSATSAAVMNEARLHSELDHPVCTGVLFVCSRSAGHIFRLHCARVW